MGYIKQGGNNFGQHQVGGCITPMTSSASICSGDPHGTQSTCHARSYLARVNNGHDGGERVPGWSFPFTTFAMVYLGMMGLIRIVGSLNGSHRPDKEGHEATNPMDFTPIKTDSSSTNIVGLEGFATHKQRNPKNHIRTKTLLKSG